MSQATDTSNGSSYQHQRMEDAIARRVMGIPGVSYIPDGFEVEDLIVSSAEKKVELNIDVTK